MISEALSPRVGGRFGASAVFICVIASLVPVGTRAQDAKPSGAAEVAPKSASADADDGTSQEYRELIEQALLEFKHKNWPEARVLFRRAHEMSPNARTLRGIGMVSYEMRDYVQAVLSLSAALADTRQPLTEAQKRECAGLLARARTFIGSYTLALEPENAEVTIDGAPLVRDHDGKVLIPFGEHALHASAPGYDGSHSKLSVQGGEQGELRIVLYKPRPDGQPASVRASGGIETTVVQPAPGLEPRASEGARGFRGHGLRYTWVALGASAAFGATAAAVWFAGEGKVDDLRKSCDRSEAVGTPCVEGGVDTSKVERFERATNALLGLSAASLATAVVLSVFEWPRERKVSISLSPRLLSVGGSF